MKKIIRWILTVAILFGIGIGCTYSFNNFESKRIVLENKTVLFNKNKKLLTELKSEIGPYLSESDELITNIDSYNVSYQIIKGNVHIADNRIIKNDDAEEYEHIILEATIEKNGKQISDEMEIVVLDEYTHYLMATFNGEDGWPDYKEGNETIFFYTSDNLEKWKRINKEAAFYSEAGSNRFRDPFIGRLKDGSIMMVSTQGYYYPEVYKIQTDDFLSYDVSLLTINTQFKRLINYGIKSWAPEFIYNFKKDNYILYFSEPNGNKTGAIYAVETNDLNELSDPFVLFYPGYEVIDANITNVNGEYILFYKKEDNQEVYWAKTDDLISNCWEIHDDQPINSGYAGEGPFLLKDIEGNYVFYIDCYIDKFIASSDVSFNRNNIEINLERDYSLEGNGVIRHLSILKITDKEYERVLELKNK